MILWAHTKFHSPLYLPRNARHAWKKLAVPDAETRQKQASVIRGYATAIVIYLFIAIQSKQALISFSVCHTVHLHKNEPQPVSGKQRVETDGGGA